MLIIRKNEVNNPIATVSMNKTLSNPYYLFSFQHIASKERVSFIPQVITSNCRYDKFRFIEASTTDLTTTPPTISFPYVGQYYYSIYEQLQSGNTNPALAYNKLESGRAVVIVGNDNINECIFEPYISDDEDFSQVIYVSEDEQVCEDFPCFSAFTGNAITDLIINSEGSIFVLQTGLTDEYNGQTGGLYKLNLNGSFDSIFNIGTGFISNGPWVSSIGFENKIVVGGPVTGYNGTVIGRIVRLNSDGSIDTTFNVGNGFNTTITALEKQSDNKMIVMSTTGATFNGSTFGGILRLNVDGSRDTTFNSGGVGFGGSSSSLNDTDAVLIMDDDSILIGLSISTNTYNGVAIGSCLIKLLSDGTKDSTFNAWSGISATVQSLGVQSTGKIIVGSQSLNRLVRLDSDGSLDNTFYNNTSLSGNVINDIEILSDDSMILGLASSPYLIKLDANGNIDNTFQTGAGLNGSVGEIKLWINGTYLIAGTFSEYDTQMGIAIANINSNGEILNCPQNINFLLQEDDEYLLQEDNDYIII